MIVNARSIHAMSSDQVPLKQVKRVYHFLSAVHGLDDLHRRRLKIARLDELNDPFELWAIAQPDRRVREALKATKLQMSKDCGVLCFSLDWHNPLLWSHYADKHHGVALGFDVEERILMPVFYRKTRPVLRELNMQVANWLLFTKFVDWRYEQESRIFATLKDRDTETGLYFCDFGPQLVLREVIAGPLCEVSLQALRNAAGSSSVIKFRKARLGFKTFRVVTDQRGFRTKD
jgi:hypothetical protein